ncbi:MAG TPA: transketolase C-terminal domain-containing protein, partial [Candidatus Sumerlaeia bacterium]|nr:transketolase C-terminal domain-containing protein [Candidatus Sumerlaeia bacterium]
PADEIELSPRRYTTLPPSEFHLFRPGKDLVPDMIKAGDGYHVHVSGLTHDEHGRPVITPECQDALVRRLVNKIRQNEPKIRMVEEDIPDDSDVILVSYGISSRIVFLVRELARKEGIKAGIIRPIVVWPFPEEVFRKAAKKSRPFVVVEMNMGQIVYEVERCAAGQAKTYLVPHAGGTVHNPEDILKIIREAVK